VITKHHILYTVNVGEYQVRRKTYRHRNNIVWPNTYVIFATLTFPMLNNVISNSVNLYADHTSSLKFRNRNTFTIYIPDKL